MLIFLLIFLQCHQWDGGGGGLYRVQSDFRHDAGRLQPALTLFTSSTQCVSVDLPTAFHISPLQVHPALRPLSVSRSPSALLPRRTDVEEMPSQGQRLSRRVRKTCELSSVYRGRPNHEDVSGFVSMWAEL